MALFVALGGTSYAAFGVPTNSVGSAQIRNGAIPSGKLTLGNKNYLRLGFGAPAAAVLAKPVLAGAQTVAPNSSPGQQLSGNNTNYTQAANTTDLAAGVRLGHRADRVYVGARRCVHRQPARRHPQYHE